MGAHFQLHILLLDLGFILQKTIAICRFISICPIDSVLDGYIEVHWHVEEKEGYK